MTPGQALQEACRSSPYLLSGSGIELARRTGYTAKHISEVFHDKARITIEMALRLEPVLRLPASHWTALQLEHDLALARADVIVSTDA